MQGDPRVDIYGPPLAPPVELSRWLLGSLGIPHRFGTAAAGLSAIRSSRLGVPIELPLLTFDGQASGGLRAGFDRITGPIAAAHGVAVPAHDTGLVAALLAKLFGPAVRSFYRPMLGRPDLLKPLASDGVPRLHRLVIRYGYGLWAPVMARGLKLAGHTAEADVAEIEACFALAVARLGTRPYLAGDRPGVADLVFATLASPVLLPPEHPVQLPPVGALPAPLGEMVQRLRATPGGALALRIYAAARAEPPWTAPDPALSRPA